jgi:hypothetical protein
MRHSADIWSATVSSTPDGLAIRKMDATEPIPSSDHIRCARRPETLVPPYSYVGQQFVLSWTHRNEGLRLPSFVPLNFRKYPSFGAVSLDAKGKSQRLRLDIVQLHRPAQDRCRPRESCTRDQAMGFPTRGWRSRFLRSRTCTSFRLSPRKGSLCKNHRHRIAEAILIRSMG